MKKSIEDVLRKELGSIHDSGKLRDIVIILSGLLLQDMKAVSEKFTELKRQLQESPNKEDASFIRFLTVLLSLAIGNMAKRKK